jgi:hypothetical protein
MKSIRKLGIVERIAALATGLVLLGLCIICAGIGVTAESDTLCYSKFAADHGIKADWSEIRDYIENSAKPGMSRAEVRSSLEQLGKVIYVFEGDTLVDGYFRDEISLDICPGNLHMGNYSLDAEYSLDGKLTSLETDNNMYN